MTPEELHAVCIDAASDLLRREGRPLPPAVVLPLPQATRVVSLTDFPDDDPARFDVLHRFADEQMRPVNAPCYGFVSEGAVADEDGPAEVVVVVYGARRQTPRITAAYLDQDTVGQWADPDELAPGAMPFLGPLQHAADAARPPDAMPSPN